MISLVASSAMRLIINKMEEASKGHIGNVNSGVEVIEFTALLCYLYTSQQNLQKISAQAKLSNEKVFPILQPCKKKQDLGSS